MNLSPRKQRILDLAERQADPVSRWWEKSRYFRQEDARYLRFVIPEGASVLALGCGNGDQLAALRPARGIGVDFSSAMIARACERHPELEFRIADVETADWATLLAEPVDYILLTDVIGSMEDCQRTFERLHDACGPHTRIVVAYYSYLWEPVLRFAEKIGWKSRCEEQNVLSTDDIANLFDLAGFEMVRRDWRQLVPVSLFGFGTLINRYVGTLPVVRRLCLRNYVIARSLRKCGTPPTSVSIIVPCRNERGNIEPAVTRLTRFAPDMEILFVEGGSRDGSFEEAERVRDEYAGQWDIKVMRQDGIGKADAVYKGFDAARGSVLMILDADLTVPPEQLDKFWTAISSGQGEYVQGTRLVYPMEKDAMRFLNLLANWTFSLLFSWLLNQRLTDTLCGTKVISRANYARLKANRGYFGDFDPFGDFDLIFGAAKLNLKAVEIPIRYQARSYGETQISRFRHGVLLLRMVVFAYRKLKAL